MRKKVCLLNLGCKVNQYEIDSILNTLKDNYDTTTTLEVADIYIVNTCAVTLEAEKKSRQMVSKIVKLNENAQIYLLGCAVQRDSKQFLGKKQVVYLTGNSKKSDICKNLDKRGDFSGKPDAEYDDNFLSTNVRTRGYVKIQDGCNNYCSYCIIPYLRGFSRSRTLPSIISEATQLSNTVGEIVLTGINMSDYKIGGELALGNVIDALKDLPARIRISSLEVNVITEKFLETLKNAPNFCPHFHLSLQSGCDNVLRKMNRHYTTEQYLNATKLIRKYFPFAGITTDIIVGFPTESDEDFLTTLNFAKTVEFSDIHFFAYSKRPGTVASRYPQIDGNVMHAREEQMKAVKQELKTKFLEKMLGQTLEVLIEEKDGDYFRGWSREYVRCYVEGEFEEGKRYLVTPVKLHQDGVICQIKD